MIRANSLVTINVTTTGALGRATSFAQDPSSVSKHGEMVDIVYLQRELIYWKQRTIKLQHSNQGLIIERTAAWDETRALRKEISDLKMKIHSMDQVINNFNLQYPSTVHGSSRMANSTTLTIS